MPRMPVFPCWQGRNRKNAVTICTCFTLQSNKVSMRYTKHALCLTECSCNCQGTDNVISVPRSASNAMIACRTCLHCNQAEMLKTQVQASLCQMMLQIVRSALKICQQANSMILRQSKSPCFSDHICQRKELQLFEANASHDGPMRHSI